MTGTGEILGRSSDLETITAALASAAGGAGSVVLVEGEAGIGKTALADAAARVAESLDLPVYRAGVLEMERRRPFGVLCNALGVHPDATLARRRAIAALLATGPAGAPAAERPQVADLAAIQFRVAEELLALVDELSRSRPAVLLVEDLHWADPASLGVLARLSRTTVGAPLVLLATLRLRPRRPELATLLADELPVDAVRMRLGPLSANAVVELAERQTQAPVGPRLRRRLAAAGGNPLFVQEVVSGLFAADALITDASGAIDVAADIDAEQALPSLAAAILDRLRSLAPGTVQLLGAAAVLGATFTVPALRRVADRSASELAVELDEAITAGVLVAEDGERMAFRHDLIHEVFYADLPDDVRRALHSDAAVELEQAGAGTAAVAEHVLRSTGSGDPRAVARMRQAATDAAGSGAPGVAVELFEAALLAATRTGDPTRSELAAELGVALVAAGRPRDGERVLQSVLGSGAPLRREAAVREALAQALMHQGRVAASFEVAGEAAAAPALSAAERSRFAAHASMAPLLAADWDAAITAGRDAAAQAAAAGDVPGEVRAKLTLAHTDHLRARWSQARVHTEQATLLAAQHPSRAVADCMSHHLHSAVLVDLDEMPAALEAGRAAFWEAERFGLVAGVACSYFAIGTAHIWSGEWDEAMAANETGLTLADETGVAWQVEALCEMALVHCWRGRRADAEAMIARAEAWVAAGAAQYRSSWVPWARAVLQETAGQSAAALATLAPVWRQCVRFGLAAEYRHLGPLLARVAVENGRGELAIEVADALTSVAAAEPAGGGLAATALRVRGIADGDPDVLLEALRRYRLSPRVHDRARCAESAAVLLARAGRRDEARPVAVEALELYAQLGAEGELARGRAALRRAGLRLGVRGPRKRPAHGWAALTRTEAEVARFVARRLSNPEIAQAMFLSRRTVAHHVSHVLAKLHMTSRAEVVAAAERGALEHL